MAPLTDRPYGPKARCDVAFFLPNLEGGGAERNVASLASLLADRGYRVDIVLAQATGPFLAQLGPGVRVVDLRARRLATSLVGLIRYLRRECPPVLTSKTVLADVVALVATRFARPRTRVTVWVAADLYSEHAHLELWRGRVAVRFLPYMYRWADTLMAVSSGVAKSVARVSGLPLTSIRVVHAPAVTEEKRLLAQEPLAHPWFQDGQPPVVLGVGRLRPQKDFATLLRAFALVRRQRPARLVILGEGWQRSALEALARELGVAGDVDMPGFVRNPFSYMAHAAVFALSSIYEGLPTVVIEALACGCPVVSSDCPSGPREILDGGRYGHLVPVGDAEALAEAILCTLSGDTRPVDPSWLEQYTPDYVLRQYIAAVGLAAPTGSGISCGRA
ncbi:MAG: glycosyltransferase [Chloroflexi bacterium]|nr:glycosyltransferase [Chloroflexota bacterium]